MAGKVDYLVGLKENVIIGHLIPAGTGVLKYKALQVETEEEPEETEPDGVLMTEEGEATTIADIFNKNA